MQHCISNLDAVVCAESIYLSHRTYAIHHVHVDMFVGRWPKKVRNLRHRHWEPLRFGATATRWRLVATLGIAMGDPCRVPYRFPMAGLPAGGLPLLQAVTSGGMLCANLRRASLWLEGCQQRTTVQPSIGANPARHCWSHLPTLVAHICKWISWNRSFGQVVEPGVHPPHYSALQPGTLRLRQTRTPLKKCQGVLPRGRFTGAWLGILKQQIFTGSCSWGRHLPHKLLLPSNSFGTGPGQST